MTITMNELAAIESLGSINDSSPRILDMPTNYNYHHYLNLMKNESTDIYQKITLFEEICKNGSANNINEASKVLQEKVIRHVAKHANMIPSTNKVRNGKATQSLTPRKLGGGVKSEITRAKNAVAKAFGGGNVKVPGPMPGNADKKKEEAKQEAAMKAFRDIDNARILAEQAGSILYNHDRILRRFDINNYIACNYNKLNECVYGLCNLIDTYDDQFGVKYKIALENIQYAMFKNGVDCDPKLILEEVTNYFLSVAESSGNYNIDYVLDMDTVLKSLNTFNESDMMDIPLLQAINEASVLEDIKKEIEKFRKNPESKDENWVKETVIKIISIPGVTLGIVFAGVMLLLGAIALVIFLGALAIGGSLLFLLSTPVLIVKCLFKDKRCKERNFTGKLITGFDDIITKAEKKKEDINKSKTDDKAKKLGNDRINIFIANLRKAQDRIRKAMNESFYDYLPVDYINENIVKDTIEKAKEKIKKDNKALPGEMEPLKKQMERYKLDPHKDEKGLKRIVATIFARKPDAIIKEGPGFNDLMLFLVISGAIAMNICIGIPAAIATLWIKLKVNREQSKKYIAQWNKAIEKCEDKYYKTTDEKAKKRIQEYKKELEKQRSKLEDFDDDINRVPEKWEDDEEEEKKDDENTDSEDSSSEDTSDFDEAAGLILTISEALDSIADIDNSFVDMTVDKMASHVDCDSIEGLCTLSLLKPTVIDPGKLMITFNKELERVRDKKKKDYFRIDTLHGAIYDLEKWTKPYELEKPEKKEEKDPKKLANECIEDLYLVKGLIDSSDHIQAVTEGNIMNSLKLASMQMKRFIDGLSDKEKLASKTLDASVDNVIKFGERALSKDNREMVIKGSLLPSASKTVKYAIALGAAWAINPALAVIGLIGGIACSKVVQTKERRMILDEIESELKVVEMEIEKAKNKEDANALRELYKIQRTLQRQRQRIHYNMRVNWGSSKADTDTKSLQKN